MSSSIASLVKVLFIPSIFLLFTIPPNIIAAPPSSLITEVCSSIPKNFDNKLCVQVLQSYPTILSTTNLFDLSIKIIEAGISSATSTRAYVESMIKKINLKSPLDECKIAYDSAIASLNSALSEAKNDRDYLIATYDILIASTDNIGVCEKAVASKGFKDGVILNGNKVVQILGVSAYEAVDRLSIAPISNQKS